MGLLLRLLLFCLNVCWLYDCLICGCLIVCVLMVVAGCLVCALICCFIYCVAYSCGLVGLCFEFDADVGGLIVFCVCRVWLFDYGLIVCVAVVCFELFCGLVDGWVGLDIVLWVFALVCWFCAARLCCLI